MISFSAAEIAGFRGRVVRNREAVLAHARIEHFGRWEPEILRRHDIGVRSTLSSSAPHGGVNGKPNRWPIRESGVRDPRTTQRSVSHETVFNAQLADDVGNWFWMGDICVSS